MKLIFWKTIAYLLLFYVSLTITQAQYSNDLTELQLKYFQAKDLFDKGKFSAAQKAFLELDHENSISDVEIKTSSRLYSALCSAELMEPDATARIEGFLADYPEHSQSRLAHFYLGNIYYRNNNFRDALTQYEQVRPGDIERSLQPEYYFKAGYCYLKTNRPEKAKAYFERASGANSRYNADATYYLAHIEYLEGNYDKALKHFEDLKNNRTYSKEIPIYMLHINYHKENFDAIRSEGPELVASASQNDKPETARIVGDAFYREANYPEALKYLEIYNNSGRSSLSREDHYMLGYTCLQLEKYKDAVPAFQKATGANDDLTQLAYYYLGHCYLKTGQDHFASSAFLSAYKSGTDLNIREDALFAYAALSTSTSSKAYNEALSMLEDYLRKNPGSSRPGEANALLADMYISSSNYKKALESLEKLPSRNDKLDRAYQQVLYSRGLELFNTGSWQEAADLLNKASGMSNDRDIQALSQFWLAETFYRQANYWGALKYYKIFVENPKAKATPEFAMGYYGLGYCYFLRKEYGEAIKSFESFIKNYSKTDKQYMGDAYQRIADCYFMNKSYNEAIAYYDKSIPYSKSGNEYALFQKALSQGALGQYQKKISTLKSFQNTYRSSSYYDDVLYEIAISYLILNDSKSALSYLDQLTKETPKSSYAIKAWQRMGLIYYNEDKYQDAIRSFKTVIEKFPGSEEARGALNSLKNIYTDLGQVDQYFAYAKTLSFASVTFSEEDSLTFSIAERDYFSGDCQKAAASLGNYLSNFPGGYYTGKATFYKAECLYKMEDMASALPLYQTIIAQPYSEFSELSLIKASTIQFNNKNYEEAYSLFSSLSEVAQNQQNRSYALTGMIRSAYFLNNYNECITSGRLLLENSGISRESQPEIHLIMARSFLALKNLEEAEIAYKNVIENIRNEWAAESVYQVAYIKFLKEDYPSAENMIYDLSDNYSSFDYWVAKGFILLSDIYVKSGDLFQAKETLRSIIENYDGEELLIIAREKLAALDGTSEN